MRAPLAALAFAAFLAAAGPARATWSTAAVDAETREVGVAGASCILGSEVIAVVVPDRGAAVAQAFSNLRARPVLRDALADAESAEAALARVATPEFDSFLGLPTSRLRQYGVASLTSLAAPASFTGAWTLDWAGARTAPGVSVQGNTLAGPAVVDDALAAFDAAGQGCRPTLADRLVAALVAGAEAGGDRRCAPELGALSAFVQVAGPGEAAGALRLRLVRNRPGEPPFRIWREVRNNFRPAPGTRAENPVLLLQKDYDAWLARTGRAPRCALETR